MWAILGFFFVCFLIVAVAFYVELQLHKSEEAMFRNDPKGLRRYNEKY